MQQKMLDYETETRCFQATKNVKSMLKYGDLDTISHPWITVFIPTYKRTDLLEQALYSVLKQWHTDFFWDILIVDNEPDNGQPNATEKLIRRLNNKRILYYRNSENMRPGDNFNRGLLLARGEWVCFLHDDDYLVYNALAKMGRLIRGIESVSKRQLGAISCKYQQFTYDPLSGRSDIDLEQTANQWAFEPLNYRLYKLTHHNIWMTAHIGGDVPSNGTTYNRNAAIESGGFNEDFGISGDLILFYRMEKKYDVYSTLQPFGLYRWGCNTMIKKESTIATIHDGFKFREYVYSKSFFNKWMGRIFRSCHYYVFSRDVISARQKSSHEELTLDDFNDIYDKRPAKIWLAFYCTILRTAYFYIKKRQSIALAKRIIKQGKNLSLKASGLRISAG